MEIPFIETTDLTRSFGRHFALHRLNLRLLPGEVSLVLGPNGAGKSTLLSILATLDRPTAGQVRFGDRMDGDRMAHQGRGLIGWSAHESMLYGDLDGPENLWFYARLYGIDEPEKRVEACLAAVGLDCPEHARCLVRHYSRGMRQRLSLARALIHDPPILLLDEPFTGLDPEGCQRVIDLLKGIKAHGRFVVLATHHLDLPSGFADQVLVLRRGKLIHQGRAEWPLAALYQRVQARAER